jgi:teichuronic acid exporter
MSELDITAPDFGERDQQSGVIAQAARSVKWSFLYNAIPRLVTPFSTMILAALLTPADFGLVAISTFITALGRIVVELGLGKTVIQRRSLVKEAATSAQWTSLLMSGLLYLALWLVAPHLAVAYKNVRVTDVVRVAALALPLASLIAIPSALLRRSLKFQLLFWVNASFLIISSLSSVVLAAIGLGAWALIWGQLIGMAISACLAWKLSAWRPRLALHWPVLRSMLGFGGWVMVSGFLNWLFLYAGNTIGGIFLGVDTLGVFSLGFNVAILIPFFLVISLTDVAYPTFCAMQESPRDIGVNLLKVQALTGAVLFPVTFGLSAVAPTAVRLLYGSKWDGLGSVIAILVIMPGMGYVWSINEAAYQAVGRPDLWTKVAGLSLLVVIPLLWLTASRGLIPFTLARFCGGWILPLGNIYLSARILKISIRDQARALGPTLLISLSMFAGLVFLTRHGSTYAGILGWGKLLTIIVLGAAAYLVALRIFQKELWDRLFLSMRRVFVSRGVGS